MGLPDNTGYAVVVNDYHSGEYIDQLFDKAEYVVTNADNPGYGEAVNQIRRAHV